MIVFVILKAVRVGLALSLFIAGLATLFFSFWAPDTLVEPQGFWMGIYHGSTIFINIVRELWMDPAMIAAPNQTGFYELGYFLGTSSFLGVLSSSPSSKD